MGGPARNIHVYANRPDVTRRTWSERPNDLRHVFCQSSCRSDSSMSENSMLGRDIKRLLNLYVLFVSCDSNMFFVSFIAGK
jgi:hypothetical protein